MNLLSALPIPEKTVSSDGVDEEQDNVSRMNKQYDTLKGSNHGSIISKSTRSTKSSLKKKLIIRASDLDGRTNGSLDPEIQAAVLKWRQRQQDSSINGSKKRIAVRASSKDTVEQVVNAIMNSRGKNNKDTIESQPFKYDDTASLKSIISSAILRPRRQKSCTSFNSSSISSLGQSFDGSTSLSGCSFTYGNHGDQSNQMTRWGDEPEHKSGPRRGRRGSKRPTLPKRQLREESRRHLCGESKRHIMAVSEEKETTEEELIVDSERDGSKSSNDPTDSTQPCTVTPVTSKSKMGKPTRRASDSAPRCPRRQCASPYISSQSVGASRLLVCSSSHQSPMASVKSTLQRVFSRGNSETTSDRSVNGNAKKHNDSSSPATSPESSPPTSAPTSEELKYRSGPGKRAHPPPLTTILCHNSKEQEQLLHEALSPCTIGTEGTFHSPFTPSGRDKLSFVLDEDEDDEDYRPGDDDDGNSGLELVDDDTVESDNKSNGVEPAKMSFQELRERFQSLD